MKSRGRRIVGGWNAWITPRLLYSKDRKFRNAGISKERCHDNVFSCVHIVLQDLKV
jgi:hypothetical protein